MRQSLAIFLLAAAIASLAAPVMADIIAPIGLASGSEYQLVFLTADNIAGTSGTEAPYNAFVNAEAAQDSLLPSTSWSAVTSTTDGTLASSNAPWLGLPVYNTQGILVSPSSQDFYSGTAAAIQYDQFGEDSNGGLVWTGVYNASLPDGPYPLGQADAIVGFSGSVGTDSLSYGYTPTSELLPVYALSGAITVPAATPEPATFTLLGSALSLLAGFRWLKRRRPA